MARSAYRTCVLGILFLFGSDSFRLGREALEISIRRLIYCLSLIKLPTLRIKALGLALVSSLSSGSNLFRDYRDLSSGLPYTSKFGHGFHPKSVGEVSGDVIFPWENKFGHVSLPGSDIFPYSLPPTWKFGHNFRPDSVEQVFSAVGLP